MYRHRPRARGALVQFAKKGVSAAHQPPPTTTPGSPFGWPPDPQNRPLTCEYASGRVRRILNILRVLTRFLTRCFRRRKIVRKPSFELFDDPPSGFSGIPSNSILSRLRTPIKFLEHNRQTLRLRTNFS